MLDRHESLAASLGAKLTGPLFLKRIEKFFDGPIKTSSSQPFSNPISWLDVVAYGKTNPKDFVLTTLPNGARCCTFMCKGVHVEITEDDWRLISSGALDRFPLEHPFEEDETAELATLDILEQRTSVLYKKADEVAARARILHHKFGHRKHEVTRRRKSQDGGNSRFRAINSSQRPSTGGQPYDLHADLLQQFIANTAQISQSRSNSGAGMSGTNTIIPASPASTHFHRLSGSSRSAVEPVNHANQETQVDIYRALVTQKTDKLMRGEIISPPCDRCRRLRTPCVKHLTACQGCTKKHAKCSWKAVTDEEVVKLKLEMGITVDAEPGASIVEVEYQLSRGSIPPRIPEEISPIGFASAADSESRPASRGEVAAASAIYSPRSGPHGARFEADAISRRHSLGPVYEKSNYTGHGDQPRDQHRLSQIATMAASSPTEAASLFGGLLNPPR